MTRVKSLDFFDLRFKNSVARVSSTVNTRATPHYFNVSTDFKGRKQVNSLRIKGDLFFNKVVQIEWKVCG